jgi:hypothetical protein
MFYYDSHFNKGMATSCATFPKKTSCATHTDIVLHLIDDTAISLTFSLRSHTINLFKYYVFQFGTFDSSFLQLHVYIFLILYSSYKSYKQPIAEMQGKAAYIRPKVVGPFPEPGASRRYLDQAAIVLTNILDAWCL